MNYRMLGPDLKGVGGVVRNDSQGRISAAWLGAVLSYRRQHSRFAGRRAGLTTVNIGKHSQANTPWEVAAKH